jgi:hypothetical protein
LDGKIKPFKFLRFWPLLAEFIQETLKYRGNLYISLQKLSAQRKYLQQNWMKNKNSNGTWKYPEE